jgi:hypothetical protein
MKSNIKTAVDALVMSTATNDQAGIRAHPDGSGRAVPLRRARPRHGHEGHIKLTELITNKYTLDEINDGYQDLMDGKNIRGVVVHQH